MIKDDDVDDKQSHCTFSHRFDFLNVGIVFVDVLNFRLVRQMDPLRDPLNAFSGNAFYVKGTQGGTQEGPKGDPRGTQGDTRAPKGDPKGDRCSCDLDRCSCDLDWCSCDLDRCSCDLDWCSCNLDRCSCDLDRCSFDFPALVRTHCVFYITHIKNTPPSGPEATLNQTSTNPKRPSTHPNNFLGARTSLGQFVVRVLSLFCRVD